MTFTKKGKIFPGIVLKNGCLIIILESFRFLEAITISFSFNSIIIFSNSLIGVDKSASENKTREYFAVNIPFLTEYPFPKFVLFFKILILLFLILEIIDNVPSV